MQQFSASPLEIAASLWRHRGLATALIRREVVGRYRGSFMGLLWSLFHPLLMLAVYTLVFGLVFPTRWNASGETQYEFALVLFAGLLIFNLFSECITRAPGLVTANVNYVKKVVFPLEILPWVSLGSALFHFVIGLIVWILAYLLFIGPLDALAVLTPLILLPLILIIVGLAWLLASLSVYLRDIAQVTGIMTSALMFLSPIFYPATAIPEQYRTLLYLNPLTPAIELVRGLLLWNKAPDWSLWAAYLLVGMAVAWLGFAWFQKTRKGFADVL